MITIRNWKQENGIDIDEIELFNDGAHAFQIYVDGGHITTIYADSPEQSEEMRVALDAGEDVWDWEDGSGHCVGTLIAQRTGKGLRKTLKRLQRDGVCYNGRLGNGMDGIIWVDKANGVYYEYETDDEDLLVDDLTDKDLRDVIMGGL